MARGAGIQLFADRLTLKREGKVGIDIAAIIQMILALMESCPMFSRRRPRRALLAVTFWRNGDMTLDDSFDLADDVLAVYDEAEAVDRKLFFDDATA